MITVVRIVKKQITIRTMPALISVLAFLSVTYGTYMLLWGLAYHRRPYEETRKINSTSITSHELEALCRRLSSLAGKYGQHISGGHIKTDFDKLFERAPLGYQKLAATSPELSMRIPSLKPGFNKEILSYLHISGIYFPFTAEANLNENLTVTQAPFVICHEMAHQLGFASEDEANYIAYLACMHHPDSEFKYAANHWLLYTSLNTLRQSDPKLYLEIYKVLDGKIIEDQEYAQKIWEKYDSPILDYTSRTIYDLFLKANDQKSGINSYNLAVKLMVGEYRKNGLKYN